MSRLGRWLENEVFPEVSAAGRQTVDLETCAGGRVWARPGGADERHEGPCVPAVAELLEYVAVRRLRLGSRLESNQIEDVLILLQAHRFRLGTRPESTSPRRAVSRLQSDTGLHFNCMQVHFADGRLDVAYSYCVSRMSLAVRWFQQRHPHFPDHRALYRAAPRYGLCAAALSLAVLLIYVATGSLAVLIAATAVEALIGFVAAYTFMRGLGSVEYDNEESRHRLEQAHTTLRRYADRIERDLARARSVQRKLMPGDREMPFPNRIEWASIFSPQGEVAGDYFDAAALDDRRAAVVFADVSGHGMAAALITVIVKMAFMRWRETGARIDEFVRRVNRDLCLLTSDSSFVVAVVAVVDTGRGEVTLINCGHAPRPFLIPSDATEPVTELREPGGMLLGVHDQIQPDQATFALAPGDTLFLVTDGVTEARDPEDAFYGGDRLLAALQRCRSGPVQSMVTTLADDVESFSAGTRQADDRTVLALRLRAGLPWSTGA